MQKTRDELLQVYKVMETEELLERYQSSTLTEVAQSAAQDILLGRGVNLSHYPTRPIPDIEQTKKTKFEVMLDWNEKSLTDKALAIFAVMVLTPAGILGLLNGHMVMGLFLALCPIGLFITFR